MSQQDFSPPFTEEYQQAPAWPERLRLWFKHRVLGERQAPPQSGYLTLIPLNDARLQPRRTALLVTLLLFFAFAVGLSVFFLVPRGVTAGDIYLQSDRMSWNISRGSYQLMLKAHIPIFNSNYLDAKVEGELRVFFYDSEAGTQNVEPIKIPARSSPYVMEVTVDASNVPNEYALAILSECMTFPRRLVFFLKGYLTVQLPDIDMPAILPDTDMTTSVFSQQYTLPSLEASGLTLKARLATTGQTRIESLDQAFLIDCINGQLLPSPHPYAGPLAS